MGHSRARAGGSQSPGQLLGGQAARADRRDHQRVAAVAGQLGSRPSQHRLAVRGLGHHCIESAEVLHRSLDRRLDLVGASRVADHGQRVLAGRRHDGQLTGLGIGQHEPGSQPVKAPRRRGERSLSGSRNEHPPRNAGVARGRPGFIGGQCVERHRRLLLAADQQDQLGQPGVPQLGPEPVAQRGGQLAPLVQLVHGPKQASPRRGQPRGVGAVEHTLHVELGQPRSPSRALVIAPLPITAAVERHPERHQLGVGPGQRPARADPGSQPRAGQEQAAHRDLAPRQSGSLPGGAYVRLGARATVPPVGVEGERAPRLPPRRTRSVRASRRGAGR